MDAEKPLLLRFKRKPLPNLNILRNRKAITLSNAPDRVLLPASADKNI
jgi:hypothetical protein